MRSMPRSSERAAHQRTDPDYAPQVEIFDNLTHEEIHAKVQLLDPAALSAGRQAWQDSATGLEEVVEQAHAAIWGAIADGWRGGAAQQAADAVRAFEQSGQQLADVLAAVAQRLGQASDAAEALRVAVPAPSGAEPDLAAALLDPGQASSNIATQKATENARLDTVRVMDSIYATAFVQAGAAVPAFPEGGDIAQDTPGSAPTARAAAVDGTEAGMETCVAQSVSLHQAGAAGAADETEQQRPAPTTDSATAALVSAPAGAAGNGTPTPAQTLTAAADASISAATTAPHATAPASSAPATTASQPLPTPTAPGGGTSTSDTERKRDERRQDADAATGLGAGTMGGLMGGAIATADAPRSGSGANGWAARSATAADEDDEPYFIDDELTFLEEADDGGELIGALDPTTPPVLGEWAEPV